MVAEIKKEIKRRVKLLKGKEKRQANYRQLKNPFPLITVFSDDEINNIHHT